MSKELHLIAVTRLQKEIAVMKSREAARAAGVDAHPRIIDQKNNEIAKLRDALDKMQRSRDRYREAWEAEKRRFTEARAALEGK